MYFKAELIGTEAMASLNKGDTTALLAVNRATVADTRNRDMRSRDMADPLRAVDSKSQSVPPQMSSMRGAWQRPFWEASNDLRTVAHSRKARETSDHRKVLIIQLPSATTTDVCSAGASKEGRWSCDGMLCMVCSFSPAASFVATLGVGACKLMR